VLKIAFLPKDDTSAKITGLIVDQIQEPMQTIGNLALSAGVSADTLRYYEKQGLIKPETKSAAGYRLYTHEAVRRIRFIKHAQRCGFTLSEICDLLTLKQADSACCADVRSLAVDKKLRIEHKLRALQAMSQALDTLILSCNGGENGTDCCPILVALESGLDEVSK
jgi:Zn(II)-responsive transcriptional regulator